MKRLFFPLIFLAVAEGAFALDDGGMVTQLIVQPASFHTARAARLDAAAMAPFIQAAGAVMTHGRPMPGQLQLLRLAHPMPRAKAEALAKRLLESKVAHLAEADVRLFPSRLPNDPYYASQWHLHPFVNGLPYGQNNYGLNMPALWDRTRGHPAVVVAVLDSGLVPHADTDPGRILPGYDFVSGMDSDGDGIEDDFFFANDGDGREDDPSDPGDWVSADEHRLHPECEVSASSWHGTHIAGIIAAATDNAKGIAGIDWQARLLPVRVLGRCGGLLSDIVDALYWSAGLPVPGVANNPYPADVVNLSFGSAGTCPKILQQAFDALSARGVVVVAAAGNGAGRAEDGFPGNCRGVITVAATDRQGQRASYSNTGAVVAVSAPGGDAAVDSGILTLSNGGETTPGPDGYASLRGTSVAAAQVSGVVALMRAVQPRLEPLAILTALRSTATPFPRYGTSKDCAVTSCGAGIVRADWAVLAAQGVDFVPDAFSIPPRRDVPLRTPVISEPILIRGLGHPTSISIDNGEYSLGCTQRFTPHPGEVSEGESVCVRHLSAASYDTVITSTLTVGGVSADFTSITQAAPATTVTAGGGGALGSWALLGLAGMILARHLNAARTGARAGRS